MSYFETYAPSTGNITFSPQGYQYLSSISNSSFYYASDIKTDLTIDNKFKMDSCWETGDIYYIQGSSVYKRTFNGTILYSLVLDSPISLATIQPTIPVANNIQTFSLTDNGCWISDNSSNKLFKTDSVLNVVSTIINFSDPALIVASSDGGCYIFDNGTNRIMKISASASVESFLPYSSIAISHSNNVRGADTDIENNLWVISNNIIYKITYSDGGLISNQQINPLSDLLFSSGYVSDVSVEKSTSRDAVYIVGCAPYTSWIAKYNLATTLVASNKLLSATYPRLAKTSQYGPSDVVYVVSEEEEVYVPNACEGFSSSSSSSSSSFGYGSSSSSSSSSSGPLNCYCVSGTIFLPNGTYCANGSYVNNQPVFENIDSPTYTMYYWHDITGIYGPAGSYTWIIYNIGLLGHKDTAFGNPDGAWTDFIFPFTVNQYACDSSSSSN